jgi:hypothetical protein
MLLNIMVKPTNNMLVPTQMTMLIVDGNKLLPKSHRFEWETKLMITYYSRSDAREGTIGESGREGALFDEE